MSEERKTIYLCLAHMSEDEMEQKYVKEAFDTPELEEKIAIAKRNNVLDSSNAVDFSKVAGALPSTPYKIWEIARMPTGKKDWVKANTEFVNPQWNLDEYGHAVAPFTCKQHDMALDGTSSLSYPDPYTNWTSTNPYRKTATTTPRSTPTTSSPKARASAPR